MPRVTIRTRHRPPLQPPPSTAPGSTWIRLDSRARHFKTSRCGCCVYWVTCLCGFAYVTAGVNVVRQKPHAKNRTIFAAMAPVGEIMESFARCQPLECCTTNYTGQSSANPDTSPLIRFLNANLRRCPCRTQPRVRCSNACLPSCAEERFLPNRSSKALLEEVLGVPLSRWPWSTDTFFHTIHRFLQIAFNNVESSFHEIGGRTWVVVVHVRQRGPSRVPKLDGFPLRSSEA